MKDPPPGGEHCHFSADSRNQKPRTTVLGPFLSPLLRLFCLAQNLLKVRTYRRGKLLQLYSRQTSGFYHCLHARLLIEGR